MTSAKILSLQPYFGGSHRAFLEGWIKHSRHTFDVLTLPAYKWKWRMRHAAVTFAEEVHRRRAPAHDLVFATDMLNLAEFRGLCPLLQRRASQRRLSSGLGPGPLRRANGFRGDLRRKCGSQPPRHRICRLRRRSTATSVSYCDNRSIR